METVCKISEAIVGWDWSAIIQAFVSIWIAIVATLALYTWKSQSKAQRQTDFLDTLTDSIHDFMTLMAEPIAMVKWAKFGIQGHAVISQVDRRLKTIGAIAYIEANGKSDSKKLGELLERCRPALSKIRSLWAKGHVLGFTNYNECHDSCTLITWQYDRILAFSQVIGNTTMNWENPEVQVTVDGVLAIEADDIETSLNDQNIKFLEFVRTNYQAILG